jgi:hypothetical protein
MHNALKTSAAFAALALLGGAAFAQTTPPPPPAPAHHGIFSRLFHPKPKTGIYQSNGSAAHPMNGQSGRMPGHSITGHPAITGRHSMMQGGTSAMTGQFIGNKNSHVFHMPGDKGALPAPQNRVYFASAAAAQAAGYHAAGSGRSMTSHKAMSHSAPMQH